MLHPYSRTPWLALALVLFTEACVRTTLEVPAGGAENPSAASMPVVSTTPALRDDFDPWATDPASTGHENHRGHSRHENEPDHAGHHHHEDLEKPGTPPSEGHEGHEEHQRD